MEDVKKIYGLDAAEEDLNDIDDLDKPGPKVSKKLVAVVLGVVVIVLTPIVFMSSSNQDQSAKEKAKEQREKERVRDVSIPQTLDNVTKEMNAQEEAGKKQVAMEQAKAASQTAVQPGGGTVPLPGPLSSGQMSGFDKSDKARDDEVKQDQERQHMVEIAGSQILVINKAGQDMAGSAIKSIDTVISGAGAGQSQDDIEKSAKEATDRALADFNSQNPDMSGRRKDEDKQWLNETANSGQSQPILPQKALSKYTVFEGSLIPAVLVTSVNSDLPGQITAQVTQNIYDGVNGHVLVIPMGSKLVGSYNNGLKIGQSRVMMAFTRLIYPSGASIQLGAMQAADGMGQAGVGGDVDNHFWKMFGSSFLVAGLSNLLQKNSPSSVTVVSSNGAGQPLADAAGQILVDTSKTILDRNKSMQPTITIPRGTKFNITVQKDMILPPAITAQRPTN